MQTEEEDNEEAEHPWYVRGVLAALTGLAISAIVEFFLVAGLVADFGPCKAIERAGVDFGMNLFVDFAPWLDEGLQRKSGPGYLFVDVDEAGCVAFASAADCLTGPKIPPALTVDVIRAARQAGAAVVMLDAAPPTAAADRARIANALAEAPASGPWFIAPIFGRAVTSPEGQVTEADPAQQIAPGPAVGRLRLAIMSTETDAAAGDGVVRQYPATGQVVMGGSGFVAPSAPFLAAALTNPAKAAGADCTYYGAKCGARPRPAAPAPGAPDRIFFTMPSLALATGARGAVYADRYLGFYERVTVSGLIQGGHLVLDPQFASGRVVVLSSSLPGAEDLHTTPLGAMPGAEILINATRAFRDFAPLVDTAPGGSRSGAFLSLYGSKLSVSFLGAIVMTPVWMAIFALFRLKRPKAWWADALVRTGCVAIFVVGMALLALFEISHNAATLRGAVAAGRTVDFLTPLFAQGLEGYADAGKFLSQEVERTLDRVYLWTRAGLGSLGARLFRLWELAHAALQRRRARRGPAGPKP